MTLDLSSLITGQTSASTDQRVTVDSNTNLSRTVSLSLSGLPEGINPVFTPRHQGIPNFDTTINLYAYANDLPPIGDYDVTLTGSDGEITKSKTFKLHIINDVQPSNLLLVDLKPVQVLYGTNLITGKNTMFKAVITSSFAEPVTTDIELRLPESDWAWQGHASQYGKLIKMRGSPGQLSVPRYISYQKTVTIPANGTIEVMLPDYGDLASTLIQENKVVYAPRPLHTGGTQYGVQIDPGNRILESIENDNTIGTGLGINNAFPTRELKMYYEIFANNEGEAKSYFPGFWDGAPLNDFYEKESRLAKQATDHVRGTYPIADENKISYNAPAILHWYSPPWYERITDSQELMNIAEHLSSQAASLGYDRWVAVVPDGWLGAHGQGGAIGGTFPSASRSCFVEAGCVDSAPYVVTHELLHNLGYGDIYSGGECKIRAEEGYWVNKGIPIYPGYSYDYMDYARCSLNPAWTSNERYGHIIQHMPASPDPEVFVFRGILSRDNTMKLRPFMRVDGVPDPSDTEGKYTIVVLGDGNRILKEIRVNAEFIKYLEPTGAVPVDAVPIVTTAEWINGTQAIEFRDSNGKVLARQQVSPNSPSVRLVSPAGGENWLAGSLLPITWDASDADGDPLTFSLAVSQDKTNWMPLVSDLGQNQYDLDSGRLQPGSYYLKIIATDGVNTAQAVSGSFTISKEGIPPASIDGAEFYIGRNYYRVKGSQHDMDIAPYISGSRTFLPVRFVAYACGVENQDVIWDQDTGTVTLRKDGKILTLKIGSQNLEVDGVTKAMVQMDVAPEITNSRTMLPVRWIAEQLGYSVQWEPTTQTVRLVP